MTFEARVKSRSITTQQSETMDWTDEKPWHGLGIDVDPKLSVREMLLKANIDRPLSNNKKLVSNANKVTFQFFKAFVDAGDTGIECVGSLDNKRIVWALARLQADFTMQGVDTVKTYLLLTSLQEVRESIQIQFLTARDACNNTLQIAIEARTKFRNHFLQKPADKFDARMIKKAEETIGLGREAISQFASNAERLANRKVDEATCRRYMFDVFQPETSLELSSIGDKEVAKSADENTRFALEAISKAPGQTLATAQSTAWGLLTAVTYTTDHLLGKTQDSRLRLAWFGAHATIKNRALELAMELL
jgi:phage/plasmid-like protein (TIGR03299 family)